MKNTILLFAILFATSGLIAQQKAYEAPWIAYPTASVTDYGVYHFRKTINFDMVPEKLVVHVSADNRYNLFVNGKRVCYGPAKGDLKTYKYDIIDIAPYLHEGKNVLAALVYNAGKDRPISLISAQTAFFLKSEDDGFKSINTDVSWLTYKNPAYQPVSYYEMLFKDRWFYGYYACGPGDNVDASKYPWDWENVDFDDSSWLRSEFLSFDGPAPWNLVPRNIPFMDNHMVYPESIRLTEGIQKQAGFLEGKSVWKIPANSEVKILFDYGVLTMGYPELKVNGGDESSIKVKYAEALYEAVNLKTHRDSIDGKKMFGVWDIFQPDGELRVFRPLWKRCFRYVQLVIKTGHKPLEIISYQNEYSGYPYPEMATFKSNDEKLNEVFEICLRTLRMCSGETYYDTPFYEQLSYGGDNRPIGMNSIYNSTDDRLFREVMRLYPQSENMETGLLHSAYPSSRIFWDMGSWSMAWIQSLKDYYYLRGDKEYVSQFVGNIERILGFYERHLDESMGILGTVRNKNFMDWSITKGSIPRADENSEMHHSVLLTLYFVHSLDCSVKLYEEIGEQEKAAKWAAMSANIKKAVKTHCWDEGQQLFRDYPDQQIFSQHTNLLAILTDVIDESAQKTLLKHILNYNQFDEYASSYFSFYLFKAMDKVGMEDEFLNHLDFWYTFLDRGHTTAGETGFASHDRSDCHAWAAHPSYYLLSLVAGIKPADIGFNSVKIAPHPGELTNIQASIPHPKGRIKVDYKIKNGKIKGAVILPEGLSGDWSYAGKTMSLHPGENIIK
jgi:hypothetical protein